MVQWQAVHTGGRLSQSNNNFLEWNDVIARRFKKQQLLLFTQKSKITEKQ